jgi:glycerol-3-phosphate O-acyltransferase
MVGQLELYQRLLLEAPYSPLVTVTAMPPADMVRYAESMRVLDRQPQALGDIMRMNAENAVLATYYRNNILHLFAMPSLLACCFIGNARMLTADIQRLVWRVYPYIAAELFLRWDESEVAGVVQSLLDAFARLNLLTCNADRSAWQRPASTSIQAMRLWLLADATIQTVERYYLAIALLIKPSRNAVI